MKILLAMDSTAESQIALAEAAGRPWPQGSLIEVLSVVDLTYAWNAPGMADALVQSAEEAVRCAAARLKAAGIDSTSLVLTGDPKTVVVDRAAATGVDLVMAGSHEAPDVVRFLMGSVARAVVRSAHCSVEIIRPRAGSGAMKILLATDGSECSLGAARSIASRPWPAGSEVRVVSVVELSPAWFRKPYPAYLDSKAMEDLRAEAMQRAQEAVAASEQLLAEAGMRESGTVLVPVASAAKMILKEAAEWGADLIVAGSHGRRGISRLMLGSVSEPVALHAGCSVEIVRPRK
ncbi:MAG TPA: universal stress protein [Bryobacteraceae bacterium]|nr:universal stress protein [Bryobacteraceae bacterium]